MTFLILCLFFLSPLLVTVIYNVDRDIFKAFNYGFKHHKQPFLLKQYTNKNRFIVLKEQYQYLYDIKDVFYLSNDFLNYFKRLEDFSKTDYVSETFYYSEEHEIYDNANRCFEKIAELHKDKCLFSINITNILDESIICLVYSQPSPRKRIEKFMSLDKFNLNDKYTYEINKIVDKNLDLKFCSSLIFVEVVDYLSVLNSDLNSTPSFTFMLKRYEKDFIEKFKEVYEHYNFKVVNDLSIYRNKKIQKEILNKIDYLIDNLPPRQLEKRVRLLSIHKEVNNLKIDTSHELLVKIQEEIKIILNSYSKFLEKEVNKDNIEVQAFYRYLKTVSKDSL